MIKQSIRSVAYAVAPRYFVDRYLNNKIIRHARRLKYLRDSADDPQIWIDALWSSHFFRPMQKQSEIFRLVEILKAQKPSTICEIGSARCGTTFLLAQAAATGATIITLDLVMPPPRATAVKSFARDEQQIICLQKNSHSPQTVEDVRACLNDCNLDVLYLDGDHSYEGIKTDFELYSPLVKRGGIIVFHDIVPDNRIRYGSETTSDVGGVPQFWKELKAAHAHVEEIVEDYEQDGFGIGILHWN
ncbi:MAG TPA: class I SAM-dependent methyltransferase [Pyrinomonadaceae bacterium]|nr:class I SAM-dependent methyltransferase [Pyrinomonadaceae bacterium]